MSSPRPVTAALAAAAMSCCAHALPPGFVETRLDVEWDQAVGLTFAPDGRMVVWEKGGRVWTVEDGVRSAKPLIDISEEVGNWRDLGLLGVVLDPHFGVNGHIYLLYTVDYHHLRFFGTEQYDPGRDEYFRDTIGRLTRYTCRADDDFRSVDPASRTVLIGESMGTGLPACHQSHHVGTLVFGEDGSLLVSCGDGASYEEVDNGGPRSGSSNTALADGIITPVEDVGAFRAQLVDSHSGKILRIDPATGDGLSDNPFFDPADPRSPRSRVWALGLRNPFRVALRPGTGYTSEHGNFPGILAIGDVGWSRWEGLEVCRRPGQNFGWPLFEGLQFVPEYTFTPTENRAAPNPLFDGTTCDRRFFRFQELIVQATQRQPRFPNPCDPSRDVPADIPTFVHERPVIDWYRGDGPSRTGIFIGGEAAEIGLDDPRSPVRGPRFGGNSVTGGAWYTADAFPPEYHGAYFFGDFGARWMRVAEFDGDTYPLRVRDFMDEGEPGFIVAMAVDPSDGALWYIDYDDGGVSSLRRVSYGSGRPPVPVAEASPRYGRTPLAVAFTGSSSYDPDGGVLTYRWDFGDGAISTEPDPIHLYQPASDLTPAGRFIGRIFELDPPRPLGQGNPDPAVMRDGVYPPLESADPLTQYDTFHDGDQRGFDWMGYEFDGVQRFSGLTFQEGLLTRDGGWFDEVTVDIRYPDGMWRTVDGVEITPAYTGRDGPSFGRYDIAFEPIDGTAIRLAGTPGGRRPYISFGELRVLGEAADAPRRRDVTLTVTDESGLAATARLLVSTDNTPPRVRITAPRDGGRYPINREIELALRAEIADDEHGAGERTCRWQTILHHDDHVHREPPDSRCETTTRITPVGCEGTATYFYEIALTVADGAGLSATASVFLFPDCCPGDFTGDGTVDSDDFFEFYTAFLAGDARADVTLDGIVDADDFYEFLNGFTSGC